MEALLDDVGSLVCRSTEGRIDIPTNLVMVQLTLLMEHEAIPVDQDRELAGIMRTIVMEGSGDHLLQPRGLGSFN